MTDIVVIPCFDRPTMLDVCLEYIQKADGAADKAYVFAKDYGYNPAIERVIKRFPYRHFQLNQAKTRYKVTKQSFNVLNALMAAARHTDALVYLIEDDIFIGRDFFRWHEAVHAAEPEIFCSIATRNNNSRYVTDGDVNAYYLSRNGDYQSLGVCYKRDVINSYLAPHFNIKYFEQPHSYVQRYWPASKIGTAFCEQDGLIRRIIEAGGHAVAFPHVARAFHGGFFGKNRGTKKKFSAADIRKIAFDKELLAKTVIDPYFVYDSEPCDLNISFDKIVYKEATL